MSALLERLANAKIEKEIEARIIALGDGIAQTHDAYREEVGFIRGLRHAIAILSDTAKDME